MYRTEKPGLLYSIELFKAIDSALEGVDEIPQDILNQMFDALDINAYSQTLHDDFLRTKQPRVARERFKDFDNEHLFYLNVRKRILASARMTKTDKQLRKERERIAYNERKKKATVPGHWTELNEIYAQSAKMSKATGVPHHVDHIVPLCGIKGGIQVVCGLHAPWNLRIITAEENVKKGSSFDPSFYCDDAYYQENFRRNFTKRLAK